MKKSLAIYFYIFFCFLFTVGCATRLENNFPTDASTTITTESSTDVTIEKENLTGIIIASDASEALLNLDFLNPNTGEVSKWKTFPMVHMTEDGEEVSSPRLTSRLKSIATLSYLSQFWAEKAFSDSFTKVAVSFKLVNDESNRVGILDEEGNLTDISKLLIGENKSFSATVFNHESPYFDNDYFYFTDHESDHTLTKYRVPLNQLNKESIEKYDETVLRIVDDTNYTMATKEYLNQDKTYFYLKETFAGRIENGDSDMRYYDEDVVGLLSDGNFLTTAFVIRRALKEPLGQHFSEYQPYGLYVDNQDNEVGLLLPDNERENYSPVISPDGTSVIFLSRFSDIVTVYQVPSTGGEPTELIADFQPYAHNRYQFISWIN